MGINFNDTKETVAERTETTNYEGGKAYEPDSPELALTKNVLTNLLEDSFYEDAEDSLSDVRDAFERVAESNPEFVLKLAAYARQVENLRQVPQLLLVLAANNSETQGYVRSYATDIMSRADEPLEALAMQKSLYGKTIPNSLKMGIEDALHTFNEYQFAKWDRPSREFRFHDLLNLVHPRPRDDERKEIFERIAYGELDSHPDVAPLRQKDTWEDEMSSAGQGSEDPADVWRRQLEENDEGYSMPIFARVRNVRNMLQSGLTGDEIFGDVTDDWIRNSKMYPFRFYQAYKAVRQSDAPNDTDALEFLQHAMRISCENLPDTFDNTFTAVDVSGSMRSPISDKSDMQCMEIATLFGAMMLERDSNVSVFASDVARVTGDPLDSLVTNANRLKQQNVGGSTNGYKVLRELRESNEEYEQIIFFTDMQLWNSSSVWGNSTSFKDEWDAYKKQYPDASLYLIDLQHYGDLSIPEGAQDVYNISGWSENVLNFIDKMENVDDMIREIESY